MKTLIIPAIAACLAAPIASAQSDAPELGRCAALYDHYDGHVHLEETDFSPFKLTYDYEARAAIARVRAEQLGQRTDWPAAAGWEVASHTSFFFDNLEIKKCDEALGFEPDPFGKNMFGRKGAGDVERPDNLACLTMMIVAVSQLSTPEDDAQISAIQQHANSMSAPLAAAGWGEDESQAIVQPLADIFNRRYADEGPVNPYGKLSGDGELSEFSRACIATWPKQEQNAWQMAADSATPSQSAGAAGTPASSETSNICRGVDTLYSEFTSAGVPTSRPMPADIATALRVEGEANCTEMRVGMNGGGYESILRCKSPGVVLQNSAGNKSRTRQDAIYNLEWLPNDITQCSAFSDWEETRIIDEDDAWSRIGRVFTAPDQQASVAFMQTRRATGGKSMSDQKIRSELWIGTPAGIAELDYVPYED
jgi:hypothetical protein